MKKFLVLLLALVVLMSLSGVAFAGSSWMPWKKSGSTVDGDIYKTIIFSNKAETDSGKAEAKANDSKTTVDSFSEAKAIDDSAMADNQSGRLVTNTGTANAESAWADALNQANNSECETIVEQAETHADCSKFVEATVCCDEFVDLNSDGKCDKCGCDCCPATVKGDIDIYVEFDNKAEAKTGDAKAEGNKSHTDVTAFSKAIASNGGTASNTDDTMVVNDGVANAISGTALSTNLVNNTVNIDIFRGALSTKTCEVIIDFLAR